MQTRTITIEFICISAVVPLIYRKFQQTHSIFKCTALREIYILFVQALMYLQQPTCPTTTLKSKCSNRPLVPDYALLKKKRKRERVSNVQQPKGSFGRKNVKTDTQNRAGSEKLTTKSANNTAKVEISDSESTPGVEFFSDTSGSIRF